LLIFNSVNFRFCGRLIVGYLENEINHHDIDAAVGVPVLRSVLKGHYEVKIKASL